MVPLRDQADREQEVFTIVAMEISERQEAEKIAQRRAAVASLKADIWAAFAGGPHPTESSASGPTLVQRHLDVPEVQIWTRPLSSSDLVLHARTAAAGDAHSI